MSQDLEKYREELLKTQRELCHSYDKLLVTLSGGALALSITFLKDVVSVSSIQLPSMLLTAWGFFVLSLAAVLGEIMCGIEGHKKAIQQIDSETIFKEKAGGIASVLSKHLQRLSAISLVIGLIFLSLFAFHNIGGTSDGSSSETNSPTPAAPATTATEANP